MSDYELRLTGENSNNPEYLQYAEECLTRFNLEFDRCGYKKVHAIISPSSNIEYYFNCDPGKKFVEIVSNAYAVNKRFEINTPYFIAIGKDYDGINNSMRFYIVEFNSKYSFNSFIGIFYPAQLITVINNDPLHDIYAPPLDYKRAFGILSKPDFVKRNKKACELLRQFYGEIRQELLYKRFIGEGEKILAIGTFR